jgi:hypothetical protein
MSSSTDRRLNTNGYFRPIAGWMDYRMAEEDPDKIDSLLEPLRELEGRFRLEVPEEYVKEERIRESSDQTTASLVITWYDVENKDPESDTEPLNLEPVIDELAEAVLGSHDDIDFQTAHERRGRHTFLSAVKVQFKPKTAGFRIEGQDIVPPDTYPVTLYVGDDVFGIDSDDGVTYRTTKNGEVLGESFESAADAAGSLVGPAIEMLMAVESSKGREDQLTVEQDFLIGISDYYLNSDTISEDAKEHLVAFVELVTNRDLVSALEHQHEEDDDYGVEYDDDATGEDGL